MLVLMIFNANGLNVFKGIETHMYKPRSINAMQNKLFKIDEVFNTWNQLNISQLQEFASTGIFNNLDLKNRDNISHEKLNNLFTDLCNKVKGLFRLCLISSNGSPICINNFKKYSNILQSDNSLDCDTFNIQNINFSNKIEIFASPKMSSLIYICPIYNEDENYTYTVFFVSISKLIDELITNELIDQDENYSLVVNKKSEFVGLLLGISELNNAYIENIVVNYWSQSDNSKNSQISVENWDDILLTHKINDSISIGYLVNKNSIKFPKILQIVFIIFTWITIFLLLFLIFNLKRDKLSLLERNIKLIQLSYLDMYRVTLQKKSYSSIENINNSIKANLPRSLVKKYSSEIDQFLEMNWRDLFENYEQIKHNDEYEPITNINHLETETTDNKESVKNSKTNKDMNDEALEILEPYDENFTLLEEYSDENDLNELVLLDPITETVIEFSPFLEHEKDIDILMEVEKQTNEQVEDVKYFEYSEPYIPKMFNSAFHSEQITELELVDSDSVEEFEDANVIKKEDGVFVINYEQSLLPDNQQLKKLVDSVLKN